MRDPDLVLRAQRAAAALERAWDRWRTMHGLGADPLPPVSSYVGYSLEEPWGQPRVVFGVAAEEAEQIAALLDRQDYVYAAALPAPDARYAAGEASAQAGPAEPEVPGDARVHVPAQAKPPADDHDARETADPMPPGASAVRVVPDVPQPDSGGTPESGLAAGPAAQAGARPADELDDGGEPGLAAFRPRPEVASYLDEGPEPDPFLDATDGPAAGDQDRRGQDAGGQSRGRRPAAGRAPGGRIMPRLPKSPRQKHATAASRYDYPPPPADRTAAR